MIKSLFTRFDGYWHVFVFNWVERAAEEPREPDADLPRIEIGDAVLVAIPPEDWRFLTEFNPGVTRDREISKKDLIRAWQDLSEDLREWRVL